MSLENLKERIKAKSGKYMDANSTFFLGDPEKVDGIEDAEVRYLIVDESSPDLKPGTYLHTNIPFDIFLLNHNLAQAINNHVALDIQMSKKRKTPMLDCLSSNYEDIEDIVACLLSATQNGHLILQLSPTLPSAVNNPMYDLHERRN